MKSSAVITIITIALAHAACNHSRYEVWKNEDYTGNLRFDPEFWRYQSQKKFILANALALQLAYGKCVAYIQNLIVWKAGRSGPIDDITTYGVMCNKFCLESDTIHEIAMEISGCSCLELSTQPNEVSYTLDGDWCRHNTGRLQCDMLGFCGVWDCRIDDFMCPRYEYNKRHIQYAGPGDCINPAFSNMHPQIWISIAVSLLVVFLLERDRGREIEGDGYM